MALAMVIYLAYEPANHSSFCHDFFAWHKNLPTIVAFAIVISSAKEPANHRSFSNVFFCLA